MLEDFIKNNKILSVCVVLAVLAAGFVLPNFVKVSKNPTNVEDLLASSFTGQNDNADLYTDISGAVKDPGVYRMKPGARMIDLINACGGFKKGALTDGINLAQALKDGDKIVVPSSRGRGNPSEPGSSAGKVNINIADQKTLESVPGIGSGTAKKILEHRGTKGPFTVPEDLKKVSGIGNSKFEKLKQYIDVF